MNEHTYEYMNDGYCDQCGRHCSLDALSCGRGRRHLQQEQGDRDMRNMGMDEYRSETSEDRYEEHERRHERFREGRGFEGHRPPHPDFDEEMRHGRGHHRPDFEEFERFGRHHDVDPFPGHRPPHPDFERGPGREHHSFREELEENQDSLNYLIRACDDQIHRGRGKNHAQDHILKILSRHELVSQRDLQEILGVKPGSLSEIVSKLEAKGYIIRIKDKFDKRRTYLQLTDEGAQKAEENRQSDEAFAMLSEEEKETLKGLLQKVLNG